MKLLNNVAGITLLAFSLVLPVANAAGETPEQMFKELSAKASKARQFENSNSVVLFGDKNESIVILDNPRWVVKGQLYDMFQNTSLSNEKELIEAETKIPFNKLKIDTVNIFSFTANPTKSKELIVFIDPFLDISSNAIDVINVASKQYRVRYILTPFTQSSVKKLFAFSCVIKGEKSNQIIKRIKYKDFGSKSGVCEQDLISKTYGVSAFLKLKKSPTLIASNDVSSHGLPQSIVAFLARNME